MGKCKLPDDLKSKLFFRLFPTEEMNWNNIQLSNDSKTICIRNFRFDTDGVFLNNTQADIYKEVTEGILTRVIEGHNAIITAFGQTGSGKSLTMGGLRNSMEYRGIIPRLISDLFKMKNSLDKNLKICIHLSYIEVINRTIVTDLLRDYPNNLESNFIKQITKIKLDSETEALEHLYKGEGRKEFVSGRFGRMSNLGSSILTFYVTTKNMNLTNPYKINSRLHFVDLAGVDTVGNMSCLNKQAVDIGNANVVKSDMEQFFSYLYENNSKRIKVKQRMHSLIQFLGEDLSTRTILRFIGHMRISEKDLRISLSLLRFGQFIAGLPNAKRNVVHEPNEELQLQCLQAQKQLNKIKNEKLLDMLLLNQQLCTNMNKERFDHIQRIVGEYIKNKTNEITVLNVADFGVILEVFRDLYNQCETTKLIEKNLIGKSSSNKSREKSPSEKSMKKISEKSTSLRTSVTKRKNSLPPQSNANVSQSTDSRTISKVKSTSVAALKRSTNRKKSSTSASAILEKKESSKSIPEVLIPEIIPEFKDAWNSFVSDESCSFKSLLDEYVNNENVVRDVYTTYTSQLKSLETAKDNVILKRKKLFEAETARRFSLASVPEGGVEETVVAEQWKKRLQIAQEELMALQETVLRYQTDLRVHLNMRQNIKDCLNDNFNAYCKKKFNGLVPSLGEDTLVEHTIDIDVDEGVQDDIETFTILPKVDETEEYLNKLKTLMDMQIRLKKMYKHEHRKWITK